MFCKKTQGTMIFGTTVRNKRHAELKMVRVRIGWEVTRGGLRPTWSLWQTDALSFVFLVNAGP